MGELNIPFGCPGRCKKEEEEEKFASFSFSYISPSTN